MESNGNFIVVDQGLDTVFRVFADSGNRVVLSNEEFGVDILTSSVWKLFFGFNPKNNWLCLFFDGERR